MILLAVTFDCEILMRQILKLVTGRLAAGFVLSLILTQVPSVLRYRFRSRSPTTVIFSLECLLFLGYVFRTI